MLICNTPVLHRSALAHLGYGDCGLAQIPLDPGDVVRLLLRELGGQLLRIQSNRHSKLRLS